ncbi:MAG: acyl-CoA reductase [Bacteroidota bacterium]
MNINERLEAFAKLSEVLVSYNGEELQNRPYSSTLDKALREASFHNGWFTRDNLLTAIHNLGVMIRRDQLKTWVDRYPQLTGGHNSPVTVAVIMAGNIPLAGFHDFLCVLMSGNIFLGKLSSSDKFLLPALAAILTEIEPRFNSFISFADNQLKGFDAVIATGSNNSSRYFNQYFGGYPHIIRHNRNSAAIINGSETPQELNGLAEDIFLYFGMGCRSVSFLMLPTGYDISTFYEAMLPFARVRDHNKYMNNYTYNMSLYLMDSKPFLDNGFLLLRRNESPASPVSVLHYIEYEKPEEIVAILELQKELLQCVVGKNIKFPDLVSFGNAQKPTLSDYADGVDTMAFLMNLKNISRI